MGKRAALVTGGAIRLGRELALELARQGFDIAVHYNSSAGPAEETAAEIRAMGVEADTFAYDFSKERDFQPHAERVRARTGNC